MAIKLFKVTLESDLCAVVDVMEQLVDASTGNWEVASKKLPTLLAQEDSFTPTEVSCVLLLLLLLLSCDDCRFVLGEVV